jgi:hypothetical protein
MAWKQLNSLFPCYFDQSQRVVLDIRDRCSPYFKGFCFCFRLCCGRRFAADQKISPPVTIPTGGGHSEQFFRIDWFTVFCICFDDAQSDWCAISTHKSKLDKRLAFEPQYLRAFERQPLDLR